MDISVVVPLYNEEESLPELFAWIERVMNANGFSYEVIFVNDGSTDRSWQVIEQLQAQAPDKVRGIKCRRNYGKSVSYTHLYVTTCYRTQKGVILNSSLPCTSFF